MMRATPRSCLSIPWAIPHRHDRGMTLPIIETERLVLRRMMAYDAPALHAMLSDPETMQYWSTPPHATLAETEAWVADGLAAMERGDGHDFVVLESDRVIGRVAFWMGNEIGFLFSRAVWGK